MIQCPDTHLFCLDCVRALASTRLADGHIDVICPSSEEPLCKGIFSEGELMRALETKTMELYHRVRISRLTLLMLKIFLRCERVGTWKPQGWQGWRSVRSATTRMWWRILMRRCSVVPATSALLSAAGRARKR